MYVRDESNSGSQVQAMPGSELAVLKCWHASAVRRIVIGAVTVMKISRFAGLRQYEVSRRQKAWQLTHEQVNSEAGCTISPAACERNSWSDETVSAEHHS